MYSCAYDDEALSTKIESAKPLKKSRCPAVEPGAQIVAPLFSKDTLLVLVSSTANQGYLDEHQ